MEQRLNAEFLRPGLVQRAAAIGVGAVGIGTAILLASWGISLLWRYTPPEIAVRIANPEVRVIQSEPLMVTQDKPFTIAQPAPFKVELGDTIVKVPQPFSEGSGNAKTAWGDVISRAVTVSSE